MGFAIYLSSEIDPSDLRNSYGYWEGKSYTVQGEEFPLAHTHKVTERTKIYTSKLRAELSAEKLFKRFGYVSSYRIDEV